MAHRQSESGRDEVDLNQDSVDPQPLLRELKGTTCRCGKTKKPWKTLCYACFQSLPRDLAAHLYRRFGKGYEEAYAAAAAHLDAKKPVTQGGR